MSFISQYWLWGLPLIAAPIIIHYLFRRKHRNLKWAASFLIQRALKTKKRRYLIEEWFLIILRTIILLFLVIALAQPEFKQSNLGVDIKRQPIVILLDSSLSTTRREGLKTVHERLKEQSIELVTNHDKNRNIFFLSFPRGNVVEGKDSVMRAIKETQTTYYQGNVKSALEQLQGVLRDRNYTHCDLEVFSDFQKSDFYDIDSWPSSWNVKLHPVKLSHKKNNAIIRFYAHKGLPVLNNQWTCGVTIEGDEGHVNLKVYDNDGLVLQKDVIVGSKRSIDVLIPLTFKNIGWHRLRVEIGSDAMEFDNVRYMNVNVQDKAKILIFSSKRSPNYKEDETMFFERALDPFDQYLIKTVSAPPAQLEGYDAYIFANYLSVDELTAKTIVEQVKQGALLAIFAGPLTDQKHLQSHFIFMPELGPLIDRQSKFFPAPNGLFKNWYSFFRPYHFNHYYSILDSDDKHVEKLWQDQNGKGVLVRGILGDGHWVLSGLSVGFNHGSWVGSPLYVGFARSLINQFDYKQNIGKSYELNANQDALWNRPGVYEHHYEYVAINVPIDESDTELFSGLAQNLPQASFDKLPEEFSLHVLFTLLILLFFETYWSSKRQL